MKLETYCAKKLSPGMIVKDYKTLCSLLNLKFISDKERKNKQLEMLTNYFDYERIGRSFLIKEIKDVKTIIKQDPHAALLYATTEKEIEEAKCRIEIANKKAERIVKQELAEEKRKLMKQKKEALEKEQKVKRELREQRRIEKEKLEHERSIRRELREKRKIELANKEKRGVGRPRKYPVGVKPKYDYGDRYKGRYKGKYKDRYKDKYKDKYKDRYKGKYEYKQKKNGGKYSSRITDIILSEFESREGKTIYITRKQLALACGLINESYINYYDFESENNKQVIIAENFYIKDFYNRAENKISSILISSLNSMQKKGYLEYQKTCLIYAKDTLEQTEATCEDLDTIKVIKELACKKVGIEYRNDFLFKNNKEKQKKYYLEFNNIIKEQFNWDKIIFCYKITFKTKALNEIDITDSKKAISELFKNFLDEQAAKNYKKHPYNISIYGGKEKTEFGYYPNYPEQSKLLSDYFCTFNNDFKGV